MPDDNSDLSYLQGTVPGTQSGIVGGTLPSYMQSADNHNVGNGNSSWLDPSTWDPIGKVVGAGKFAAVSLASGINSFYNTGASVANWFGADAEQNDVATQLSALDSNLGEYYNQNRQGADLMGFLVTSMIPGVGGVKILNAGQKMLGLASKGLIGANMAVGSGLLADATGTLAGRYALKAGTELAAGQSAFSLLNSNVLKSIAAGVGQNALEAAVFQTAVTATMYKSPLLQDQDFRDIVHNIFTGSLVGGAFGGAITAAVNKGIISKVIKASDLAEKPFTHITDIPNVSLSGKVLSAFNDLEDMKSAFNADHSQVPDVELLMQRKTNLLMQNARVAVRELASGDSELGNDVMDSLVGTESLQVEQNMFNAKEIGRSSSSLPSEESAAAYAKDLAAYNEKAIKRGSIYGLKVPQDPQVETRFIKLLGEDAGSIYSEAPKVLSLADSVEPVTVGGKTNYLDAINSKVDSYGFNSTKPYDPLTDTNLSSTKMEARYLWSDRDNIAVLDGIKIHENDIPLLERAAKENIQFQVERDSGYLESIQTPQDAAQLLQNSKNDLIASLSDTGKYSNEEIAKIANVKLSYVEGTQSTNPATDLMARQDIMQKYNADRVTKGLQSATDPLIDTGYKPTIAKIGYSTAEMQDLDENEIRGMSAIKAAGVVYQTTVDTAFTALTKELADRFYHPSEELILGASREGSGPGLFSFSSGNYHSIESWAQQTGAATHDLIATRIAAARETLNPIAYRLANNPSAAIEFQAINDLIARTTEKYVLNDAGDGLIARSVYKYQQDVAAGKTPSIPKLQEGAPAEIPVKTDEARDMISTHIDVNGINQKDLQTLRASQGLEDSKDPSVYYPIKPNPRDYPHFAFVVDPTITGVGHTTMLHAADPETLQGLISKVPSQFKVYTKEETEAFHKAIGDYSYDQTLHDNYIDSSLHSKGIDSPFFTQTDPQKIANDILEYHTRAASTSAREIVSAKFEKEFNEFRNLGSAFSNEAVSKFGNNTVNLAESDINNPYISYIKTALDVNQSSSTLVFKAMNTKLDEIVSKAWNAISGTAQAVKTPEDLDALNQVLQENGVSSGYRDAATDLLANHVADKGVLNDFVRKANSIMSGLLIRTDAMNALNTAIGHNVLLLSEANSFARAVRNGNSDLVGPAANLVKVQVPGTESSIISARKVLTDSIKDWWDPNATTLSGENLGQFFSRNGWNSSIRDNMHAAVGSLAIDGTENAAGLNARIASATSSFKQALSLGGNASTLEEASTGIATPGIFDKVMNAGEQVSGNSVVHSFNNFMAANVARKLTDPAVEAGFISESEQLSYIHTFINRVHGNILASQRPLMFQGPIGNAIGLFQSYQFNMMQQAFRYVSTDNARGAAMILGLQGTLHGANGLPGFNFMNEKIVGESAGNPTHQDLTGATYQVLGKQLGDWFLYGAPSNILGNNLYGRGDLNPRNATVIPTSIGEIPALGGIAKLYGSLSSSLSKIAAGGNVWETFLQGIEHNGISRPLAGLAQTLQGAQSGESFSTTGKGNIMGANDLFSLATAARLMGGKPLDEAIAQDEVHRIQAYAASDTAKKETLSEAIKTTLIGGGQPTTDQITNFASEYSALGGKQKNFIADVMHLNKVANTSQANAIASSLTNPEARNMQRVMGGDPIMDGRNTAMGVSGLFSQTSNSENLGDSQ